MSDDRPILKSAKSIEASVMEVCKLWAADRSKDPSTKVAACVVDSVTGGLFVGYNGFPAGILDREDVWTNRIGSSDPLPGWNPGPGEVGEVCGLAAGLGEVPGSWLLTKYDLAVHAEQNAARKALIAGVDLRSALLVTTVLPCPACMRDVVLANRIPRVVYASPSYVSQTPRDWWVSLTLAALGHIFVERLLEDDTLVPEGVSIKRAP